MANGSVDKNGRLREFFYFLGFDRLFLIPRSCVHLKTTFHALEFGAWQTFSRKRVSKWFTCTDRYRILCPKHKVLEINSVIRANSNENGYFGGSDSTQWISTGNPMMNFVSKCFPCLVFMYWPRYFLVKEWATYWVLSSRSQYPTPMHQNIFGFGGPKELTDRLLFVPVHQNLVLRAGLWKFLS